MIARLLERVAQYLPRREIKDDAGTLYLSRYRIVGAMMGRHAWFPFTAYLHHFHRPDEDRALHNHPWPWAVSCILAGGYREQRRDAGITIERRLQAPALNFLRGDTFHRVAALEGETWTLFVVGRKHQPWGFDVPGRGFVPWRVREAEARAVRESLTRAVGELRKAVEHAKQQVGQS